MITPSTLVISGQSNSVHFSTFSYSSYIASSHQMLPSRCSHQYAPLFQPDFTHSRQPEEFHPREFILPLSLQVCSSLTSPCQGQHLPMNSSTGLYVPLLQHKLPIHPIADHIWHHLWHHLCPVNKGIQGWRVQTWVFPRGNQDSLSPLCWSHGYAHFRGNLQHCYVHRTVSVSSIFSLYPKSDILLKFGNLGTHDPVPVVLAPLIRLCQPSTPSTQQSHLPTTDISDSPRDPHFSVHPEKNYLISQAPQHNIFQAKHTQWESIWKNRATQSGWPILHPLTCPKENIKVPQKK